MIPNPVEGLPPHRPPHPGRRPRAFTTDLYTVAPPVRGFLLRFRNIGRYENRVTSASCFRSFGNRDRSPPYTVISSDNTPLSVFCFLFRMRLFLPTHHTRFSLPYRIIVYKKTESDFSASPNCVPRPGISPHPPSFYPTADPSPTHRIRLSLL